MGAFSGFREGKVIEAVLFQGFEKERKLRLSLALFHSYECKNM